MSAIRIVDVFHFMRLPDVPLERQTVAMYVLVLIKLEQEGLQKHTLQLNLVRPSGETSVGIGPLDIPMEQARYPEAFKGIVLNAETAVVTREEGRHC